MQRVPDVSRDDVVRVIRREYPSPEFAAVLSALDRYRGDGSERGRARVQLAILKLAAGDATELARHVEAAVRDFRDVLAQAEYPEDLTSVLLPTPPDADARRALHERDWEQYRRWLERT